MGRCYEFGVLVGDGCEHAMVVPAGGGRCECATCGVSCTGKFAACTAIIDQPGYVPSTAPAWAVAIGAPAPAPVPDEPVLPASPAAESRAPRPPSATAPAGDLTELIEAVAKQLSEHDVDLVTRIDALAGQVGALQRQSASQSAALEAVVAALNELVKRLDESSRPAPLFGFPRRQP